MITWTPTLTDRIALSDESLRVGVQVVAVQRAVEAQERIIQTTTELKKALMHKLFIEGIRNEPQKQTEIGLVPNAGKLSYKLLKI